MPMTWALAGHIGIGVLVIGVLWCALCLLAFVIRDMFGVGVFDELEQEREQRDRGVEKWLKDLLREAADALLTRERVT